MVFVNSQKFACASCIKGHRSSSCHHTDRPLFEIKKKGRPISQCERCRQLRKNKHMHVKCTCANDTSSQSGSSAVPQSDVTRPTPHQSAQRRLPSSPALPHGLRDLWSQDLSSPVVGAHPKQTVDALLNPCNCKSIWKCKCPGRSELISKTVTPEEDESVPPVVSSVESCCEGSGPENPTLSSSSIPHGTTIPTPTASSHREQRQLERAPYLHSSHARLKICLSDMPDSRLDSDLGLDLPPLQHPSINDSSIDDLIPRVLPSLKSVYMSARDTADANALALASLTRCGCGSTCTCPGCKEHRGDQLATLSGEDCPDRCGSCVDHMGGIALPPSSSITLSSSKALFPLQVPIAAHSHAHAKAEHSSASMSSLDHYHAVAALLPPPPRSSCGPGMLDPTNVAVYRQPSSSKPDWRKAAGLVQVPALNCCEGRCKCPGGMCGCGTECGGSCGRHSISARNSEESETPGTDVEGTGKENGSTSLTANCCSGKKTGAGGISKPPRNILRL